MRRGKIVITEPIDSSGVKILEAEAEVLCLHRYPEKTLLGEVGDSCGVVVRLARIDEAILKQGKNLRVIAKHGTGLDNIDVSGATKRKIAVVFTPEANFESVAEHALGLMLALSKKICITDRLLREARPRDKDDYMVGLELSGKRLGLVGLGRTGGELARKCKAAFDMEILFYDPHISQDKVDQAGFRKMDRLEDLLIEADYVSIHAPLTDETRNLIGQRELDSMKEGAFLINTSRGGVVDEAALYRVLARGKIAGAALDVFSQEPLPPDHPLLNLDNFIATPHIAGVTRESMQRMATSLAKDILRVLRGERPKYPANPEVYDGLY